MKAVLAGAHGHGRWHLENLRRLDGPVRLAGICDLVPVAGADVPQGPDLPALIERTGADIAIVATPIHTHADLTRAAMAAGAHVLLEKPTTATFADFARLAADVAASPAACQVGFQSLGSAAVGAVRDLVAGGAVGAVRGIGVAGSWHRPSAYFTRARWSGRRRLDGADVVDGALTNPFAHAVATALAVDGSEDPGDVRDIELELFHANPIESDDTSALRLRTANGTVVTVAVTLCARRSTPPYLVVHGETGRIVLAYTRDEVTLHRPGGDATTVHRRTDLLTNLADHVRGRAGLLVPVARTGGFMRVLEAVRTAPDPRPIPRRFVRAVPDGRTLPGVEDLVARSARELALFSELGADWAGAA
ncbi:oxidoreductase [Actinomadura sp. CNU-125]|uniref:Gfo/Idh/MocA family protein n=1 Tax=Actinomadura sp. CNU-125 TaxID=1904961 RepID=UPI000964A4A6|nr:Gfo/Idh/MocA family oxidoreductase [Actinomadura sp. CNU-125]OLT38017.1 oxidoreductase [Actinomadura sp. CNU-125]